MHAGGRAAAAAHTEFLGLPILPLVAGRSRSAHWSTSTGTPYRYVVTPNAYHVVAAHEAPQRLLPVYRGAWLSLCDSRIIRVLARLDRRVASARHRQRSGCRVACRAQCPAAPPARRSGFWSSVRRAPPRRCCAPAYPNVTFEIMPAPGGLAQSADLRLAVARACMNRHWDICCCASAARRRRLIAHEIAELGCKSGVALCVGASIDFLTGVAVSARRSGCKKSVWNGPTVWRRSPDGCGAGISSSRRRYCASL